mmetsp:Transcript_12849/g.35573  ORF Transcript_12849/g.35573 Transcript_12849/m.35573 type:complete len:532 (+) Transcript_12849:76-1671(+)
MMSDKVVGDEPDVAQNENVSNGPSSSYVAKPRRISGLRPNAKTTSRRELNATEDDNDGILYKSLMKSIFTKKLLTRFPGCFAFLFGIVIPCFILMFLALIFGTILARLEAPKEVERNDDNLASLYLANRTENTIIALTTNISKGCLESWLLDTPLSENSFDEEILDQLFQREDEFFANNSAAVGEFLNKANFEDLHQYLKTCGDLSREWTRERFAESLRAHEASGLSFNWIRCYEGAADLKRMDFDGDLFESSVLKPSEQGYWYTKNWIRDYHRLEALYREEYGKDGKLTVREVFQASDRALEDATGGNKCNLNGSGSAWFWFTIETTVGYGNQAPESRGGRALVFTCGFFSILAFAALLSTTGRVLAELTDRTLSSWHPALKRFTHPGWGSMFWGMAWIAWMLLMAYVVKKWKSSRLGEPMDLGEAYWFSYISTTTVGLGDFFLEPEVMVGIDLLYMPLMYLFGFTLLSAFLTKLATFLTDHLSNGKRSFVDSVLFNMGGTDGNEDEDKQAPESAPQPEDDSEEDIIVAA